MSPIAGARRLRFGFAPLLLVLSLPTPASAAADGVPRVVSTAPLDGARWIRPSTAILLRYDRAAALEGAALDAAVVATGAVSGPHPGHAHLARAADALIFQPDRPFDLGERVTVQVSAAASPDPGRLGDGRSFTFEIASRIPSQTALPAELEGLPDLPGAQFAHPAASPPAGIAALDSLPADFPLPIVQRFSATAPGDLFLASFSTGGTGTPYLMILNEAGGPVWYEAQDSYATDFRLHANGLIAYCDTQVGAFVALDSTLTPVETWSAGNGYYTDLHELRLLSNGHALLLAVDPEVVDMSAVVPGGNPQAVVDGMVIQEQDENHDVVFQWRSFDHFQISDAIGQNLKASVVDYVHSNAIEVDSDGNLLLSSRHLSEITKIDRTTGETIWRWGGRHNQFTFLGDTTQFSYQHAIRRLANGHYTLFDNGNMRTPQYARACEYALDPVQHTATLVWSYRPQPDARSLAMGFVERLPNGNTLVSFGTGKPDAIEVDPAGNKVMQLNLPDGVSSYRIVRRVWDAAIAGVAGPARTADLAFLGPNPARGNTVLMARLPRAGTVSLSVFDLQGRVVATPLPPTRHEAGVLTVPLALAGRPSGVYFCRLVTEQGAVSRRLLLVE